MSAGLAVSQIDDFVFGTAPRPVTCGRGVVLGNGSVVPEINFTLPPLEIDESSWAEVRSQYREMVEGVCQRAVELGVPALLVEFETLPPMTIRPEWGAEITRLLADTLGEFHTRDGLRSALRLTPNDIRDAERPIRLRGGACWDGMVQLFEAAGGAGADLLAIESTGGKEVHDPALMNADLRRIVFALGVLAPRDMEFLWDRMVEACRESGVVPSGDSACGFANTAMVLAEQKMIPRVLAAAVRVASVPRSLVACRRGALGPSKDCAYEGPYLKAIAGIPISMEGRSAACAHLSPVGNIAQALCDCWSNESVQNVRLLSTRAPTVCLEQLAYDCRLLNVASGRSREDARRLRDWLVESDAALDPQAYVLRPDVVLRISEQIAAEPTPYRQTRRAVVAALDEISRAHQRGEVSFPEREGPWLERLRKEADGLPEDEAGLLTEMLRSPGGAGFLPEEYGLDGTGRS